MSIRVHEYVSGSVNGNRLLDSLRRWVLGII